MESERQKCWAYETRERSFHWVFVTKSGESQVKQKYPKRRSFVDADKTGVFTEYLIKCQVEGERRTETLYILNRITGDHIERRPATHAEKVRLHMFVNEETALPDYPSTRMRDLLTSLALAIYMQDDQCPPQFKAREWDENLARAKANAEKRRPALNLGEITSAIIPRRRGKNWRELVCGACRTPLLTGYVLDGQKITRGKECCGDACRVAKHRFKKHAAQVKSL
jgi:hypothetical protein